MRATRRLFAGLPLRLALLVLLAAAAVAPSAPAGARADHAAHHAMVPGEAHGDPDRASKGHAVAHVCPGCALAAEPAAAGVAVPLADLPGLPANAAEPRPFAINPIPPPPRAA